MPDPSDAVDPADIIHASSAAGLQIATAESLTGGAVVARLVDVPGASTCVAGGLVCYSYAAKSRLLGVDPELLRREGAVTEEVARAMARGARDAYGADLAVSTTGVAGPGPDERGVAAGTVHLALARAGEEPGDERVLRLGLAGDRRTVRERAREAALDLLAAELGLLPSGEEPGPPAL